MGYEYCENQGWKLDVIHSVDGTSGGYSQIECQIKGENVYSKLKYESGSHRVQRIPVTETQGRVHTSTATVLVMPEAEEVDVVIDENDNVIFSQLVDEITTEPDYEAALAVLKA